MDSEHVNSENGIEEHGTCNTGTRNTEHGTAELGPTTYEIRVAGGSSIQGRCASTERPGIRYTPFRSGLFSERNTF